MPTVSASIHLFDNFILAIHHGVHNFSSDQIAVALTNTLPSVSADATRSDLTEISYTNLPSRNVSTISSGIAGGQYQLIVGGLMLSPSPGSAAGFRYAVYYNTTNDALIGFVDYSATITLAPGDSFSLSPTSYLIGSSKA